MPPRDRLETYLAAMTAPDSVEEEYAPDAQFFAVIVELRAQAARDDDYRDHFDRSDRVFEAFLERALREAAADYEAESDDDAGEIPPAEVASTLQTLATGGMLRWATTADRGWVDGTRRGARRYLETVLPRIDADA